MARNRIKLVFIWVIELMLCIFYHNIAFRLLFIASFILPCISLIQLFFVFRYVDIAISVDENIKNKSCKNKIFVSVTNRSFFPISEFIANIEIHNTFYDEKEVLYINIPVTINGTQTVSFDMTSSLCGNLCARIVEIKGFDMLCLKGIKKKVNIKTDYMVIPNTSKELDLVSLEDSIQKEYQKEVVRDDPYEIASVREYIDGDRLHNIHWKLSLKQDDLMVKVNDIVYDSKIRIVLELYDDKKNMLESVLEIFLCLAKKLIGDNREFLVGWYNYELARYYTYEIKSKDDINKSLKKIFYTKVSTHKLNSYTAYCDERSLDDSKALYITKNSCISGVSGDILGSIDDEYILMSI